MRSELSFLAALLLLACDDLPAPERDTCGNSVIEEGEQCDGFGALGEKTVCGAPEEGAHACQYVCGEEGVECPAGWGCDDQRICRHATGAYVSATPVGGLLQPRVGDFDQDGLGDVAGLAGTRNGVQVWFSQGGGALGDRFHLAGGNPDGQVGFGDLDRDGKQDVVTAGRGVAVLRGRAERVLEPVTYSSFEIPAPSLTRQGLQVFPVADGSPRSHPLLFTNMGGAELALDVLNVQEPEPDYAAAPKAGAHAVYDLAGRLPRAQLDLMPTGEAVYEDFAVGFLGDRHAAIYTLVPAPGHPIAGLAQRIELPGRLHVRGVVDAGGAPLRPALFDEGALRFADVNGDGRLDLLASVLGEGERAGVAVALGNGDRTFAEAAVDPRFSGLVEPGECRIDRRGPADARRERPWPLAAGDLNGDGLADFVNEVGAWVQRVGAPHACLLAGDFALAAVLDFNRDGHLDVASVPADGSLVELRLGDGRGAFNRVAFETNGPPHSLRTGDFDGDFAADVTWLERTDATDEADAYDEVWVLFGAVEAAPGPAISMGRLGAVEYFETSYSPYQPDPDVTHDLFVQSVSGRITERGDERRRTLAILEGSPQRRMLAPFVLRDASFALGEDDRPIDGQDVQYLADAVLVAQLDGDDIPDIAAVAHVDGDPSQPAVWRLGGGPDAQLPLDRAAPFTADCGGFQWRRALWAAGDLDGDGRAELVGADGRWADVARPGIEATAATRVVVLRWRGDELDCRHFTFGDSRGGVRQLELADTDADGKVDFVLIAEAGEPHLAVAVVEGRTAPRLDPVPGAGALTVLWNDDGALREGATHAVDDDAVLGAATLNADADPALEIGLLTHRGVVLFDLDRDLDDRALARGEAVALPIPSSRARLAAGDVTGDDLDDLVVADADQTQVHVAKGSGLR